MMNDTFLLKLVQGLVSGLNLAFLFKNLGAPDFAFLSSQGSAMMALGIIDIGIGAKFVNSNVSAQNSNSDAFHRPQLQIQGLQYFAKIALLVSLVLTGFSIPVSLYFLDRFRLFLDVKSIGIIALATFIFLIGNFASKIYLTVNSLSRMIKIQSLSSLIQLLLTIVIFSLKYSPISYVFLLCIPNAILLLDSLFLINNHHTKIGRAHV